MKKSKKKKYHQIGSASSSTNQQRKRSRENSNVNTLLIFRTLSKIEEEKEKCLQELENYKEENRQLHQNMETVTQQWVQLNQNNLNLTNLNNELKDKLEDLENDINLVLSNEQMSDEEKLERIRAEISGEVLRMNRNFNFEPEISLGPEVG